MAMEGDDELHLEDSYVLRERRISNAALNLLDVSQEDYAEFTPRWSNDGNDWLVEDGVHRLQPDDIGARLSLALRPWLLQSSRPLSVCWHACQKEEGGFSTRASRTLNSSREHTIAVLRIPRVLAPRPSSAPNEPSSL